MGLPRELRHGEWLRREINAVIKYAIVDDCVATKPGRVDYFEARASAQRLLGQLPPAHARHHHIGKQQADVGALGDLPSAQILQKALA